MKKNTWYSLIDHKPPRNGYYMVCYRSDEVSGFTYEYFYYDGNFCNMYGEGGVKWYAFAFMDVSQIWESEYPVQGTVRRRWW